MQHQILRKYCIAWARDYGRTVDQKTVQNCILEAFMIVKTSETCLKWKIHFWFFHFFSRFSPDFFIFFSRFCRFPMNIFSSFLMDFWENLLILFLFFYFSEIHPAVTLRKLFRFQKMYMFFHRTLSNSFISGTYGATRARYPTVRGRWSRRNLAKWVCTTLLLMCLTTSIAWFWAFFERNY